MVCQCVKGHMGRGAVPGKASEHSNLQRLNLSLMHVFWFDPSSHQQSMWNHWPYQKLGISHMWSTGGKVCQNVSRRAPLFPAPQEASFCFQLRKWLMTVCRVQVSMCSQLWPWTPINWPAPTLINVICTVSFTASPCGLIYPAFIHCCLNLLKS